MKFYGRVSSPKINQLPGWAKLYWLALGAFFALLIVAICCWHQSHMKELDQRLQSIPNHYSTH